MPTRLATLPFSRRDVLILAGAGLGFAQGCAILRGGAVHPKLDPSEAKLDGDTLRIPLSDLRTMGAADTLQVKAGENLPDLLIGPDGNGGWRIVTAKCPHAGCVVDWNGGAREWTCPCHSSRFAEGGTLLGGPAKEGLRAPPAHVDGEVLAIDVSALRPGRT